MSVGTAHPLYSYVLLTVSLLKPRPALQAPGALALLVPRHGFPAVASGIAVKPSSREGSESELDAINLGKWYLGRCQLISSPGSLLTMIDKVLWIYKNSHRPGAMPPQTRLGNGCEQLGLLHVTTPVVLQPALDHP